MSDRVAAPTDGRACKPRNWLLAALPDEDLLSLWPHLEVVPLARGSVVFDANEPVTNVFFVETGVVSLQAVLNNRTAAGVAMVGWEGAIGLDTVLLGGECALGRYQVLLPGSSMSLEVGRFRSTLRESAKLRAACEAYTQALFIQVLQTVSCSRLHTVEQRYARWLLMCAERTEGDAFETTEGSFGAILGVPRPKIAAIACALQQAGLIRYRRGAITAIDRKGLEAAACECYWIIRDRLQRLLAHTFD